MYKRQAERTPNRGKSNLIAHQWLRPWIVYVISILYYLLIVYSWNTVRYGSSKVLASTTWSSANNIAFVTMPLVVPIVKVNVSNISNGLFNGVEFFHKQLRLVEPKTCNSCSRDDLSLIHISLMSTVSSKL